MLKITCIGKCGKDAEIKTLQGGKTVISFSVASSEKYNGTEKTTWLDCSYFTDKTGIVPYLKKGTQVYIEGNPEVRTYQKNDGTTGTSLSVRIHQVQLLGGGQQQARPQEQTVNSISSAEDESLPF